MKPQATVRHDAAASCGRMLGVDIQFVDKIATRLFNQLLT